MGKQCKDLQGVPQSKIAALLLDSSNSRLIDPSSDWDLNFETENLFWHMRTTKGQISLRIRAVWSAPFLFAAYIVYYLQFLYPKFQASTQLL